jgi:FdhD protein
MSYMDNAGEREETDAVKDDQVEAMTIERPIVSIRDGGSGTVMDRVIREDILRIVVNGETFVSLACLPESLEELAVGFLRSEGVIDSKDAVEAVEVDPARRTVSVRGAIRKDRLEKSLSRRFLTSGCGIVPTGRDPGSLADGCLKVRSDYVVGADTVLGLMHEVNTGCLLFNRTGAAHTAALAVDGTLACVFEDISRHNAVDKVIGKAFLEGWETSRGIILSSGRLSLEIAIKCAAGGVPVVVSRTAPMQMALEVADELLMTLVGFTRGRRMNVYTHPWRIRP